MLEASFTVCFQLGIVVDEATLAGEERGAPNKRIIGMDNYLEKIHKEREWHNNNFNRHHFFNSKLFYSDDRQRYNYSYAKREMRRFLEEKIARSNSFPSHPSLLIAPIGTGDDLKHLSFLTDDITGVDVAQEALDKVSNSQVKLMQCDMRKMECFSNDQFDIVVTPLFFHHFNGMHKIFVNEIFRVLKPSGIFISLEPSNLHPLSWLTRPLRKVVGNITEQVEDESPFFPGQLLLAMKESGFEKVTLKGASFSHNRLPIWFAKLNNVFTHPMKSLPLLKYFAWVCLYSGQKPNRKQSW